MEVRDLNLEVLPMSTERRHLLDWLPDRNCDRWELRNENGVKVGVIFDRKLAEQLGLGKALASRARRASDYRPHERKNS